MSEPTHTTVGGSAGSNDDTGDERTMERMTAEDMDQVTLSFTADVSDMGPDETEMIQALATTFEDAFKEIIEKNRGYGFSFIETGNEVAQRPGGKFDSSVRATANGLFHRTGDKRSRFYKRMFDESDGGAADPIEITARENANYWMLMSLIVGHPEFSRGFFEDD
jgi:hypothetical protein